MFCELIKYLREIRKCRKFGIEENTIDFIGHALALHRDDDYLNQPAYDTVMKVKVCFIS